MIAQADIETFVQHIEQVAVLPTLAALTNYLASLMRAPICSQNSARKFLRTESSRL